MFTCLIEIAHQKYFVYFHKSTITHRSAYGISHGNGTNIAICSLTPNAFDDGGAGAN